MRDPSESSFIRATSFHVCFRFRLMEFHAITVNSPSEVSAAFSTIAYDKCKIASFIKFVLSSPFRLTENLVAFHKAACVFRMLQSAFGDEFFKAALTYYLEQQ